MKNAMKLYLASDSEDMKWGNEKKKTATYNSLTRQSYETERGFSVSYNCGQDHYIVIYQKWLLCFIM